MILISLSVETYICDAIDFSFWQIIKEIIIRVGSDYLETRFEYKNWAHN
jgi:hypothetical protein